MAQHSFEEKFILPGRTRGIFIGLSILGALLVVLGSFLGGGSIARFWASFLLGNFFFTAIAGLAIMWIAINYIANAGWSVAFKRIPEAMSSYLWFGAVAFAVLVGFSFIGHHDNGLYSLYHWLHLAEDGTIANHHTGEVEVDEVLMGKRGYLNLGFFLIRFVAFMLIWILFREIIRKTSIQEDMYGGLKYYKRMQTVSAGFVPLFGLTFAFFCYDFLMSLEPHWYSTIYAVNIFAGALVTFCTLTAFTIMLLKQQGLMTYVNDSHLHDLGKFMFGFSIFWTYTWVAQFLLIWYANLPEEIPYYLSRMHGGWYYLFFTNLTLNFAWPFLALMMRNSKRAYSWLFFVGGVMIIGRFIDWYLLIMPGSVGDEAGFGFYEIGFFLFFGGVFGLMTAWQLTKANLAPINHPYMEESAHHAT